MIDPVDLAGQGLCLSRIVYGCWRLADDPDTSPAHVRRKVELCLDQGITTFDQADIYGDYRCEALLGEALRDAPTLRAQMQIISKADIMLTGAAFPKRRVKFYDTSPAHLRTAVEQSLSRLGVEALDGLLIHRPDPFMDHAATGAALDALVTEGKVRTVGVSNFMPWDLDLLQSAMKTRLSINQIEMSLLAREPFTDGTLAQLQQTRRVAMAWSPLAGGRLFADDPGLRALQERLAALAASAGVAPAALATAWLLAHPARIVPILGSNNLERIATFSQALGVTIDRETWFELWTIAAGQEVP
ncbi:MAG: aldo/keto reductase [Pseudomonadota bacterium]